MIGCIYVLLNVLTVLYFFKFQKKRFHVLEIVTYWMTSIILVQNYSALLIMNFQFTEIPDIVSFELTDLMNRTILYPLLILMFLNRYIALTSPLKKIAFPLGYMWIVAGMEWLDDGLGIHRHKHWKFWWSLSVWLAILLISIGFMWIFRNILKKGIRHRELRDRLE